MQYSHPSLVVFALFYIAPVIYLFAALGTKATSCKGIYIFWGDEG